MNINPKSHIPIYLQIADRIRAAVAAGVYRGGEMLPSLRVLAIDLQVNPNTVQRAYDELEREGVIESRRGVGMFVAKQGAKSAQSRADGDVKRAFLQAVQAALDANMEPQRIRQLFDRTMDEAVSQTSSPS